MKKIYGCTEKSRIKKVDAQEVGEYLDALEDKTTIGILNSIENDSTCIIRKYLEWDNDIAGLEYRLAQIRNIVNHITVEIIERGECVPVKAFYSILNSSNNNAPKYVTLETTLTNKHYKTQIIKRAKAELISWSARYKHYKELKKIVKIVNSAIEN